MITNKHIIEIKILDYIKDRHPKFKIQYIFMKNTEYEEYIIKEMDCDRLINQCQIGGIIPSLNQWRREDNYWIGIDTKGKEFKFNTNDKETEYNILHSTWSVDNLGYVLTNKLNNSIISWKLHRVIMYDCNKIKSNNNSYNFIDHINNNPSDNRIENLRIVNQKENSRNINNNNKFGVIGLVEVNKNNIHYGFRSGFKYGNKRIWLRTKKVLEEAKIDNLIAQQYLGYKHNEDQFYKLEGLSEERIKEVTDLLDEKIENNKHKSKKEKEYEYDYIEKDNLMGIKTFKRDGTPNEICWVDEDFGRVEGDKYIVNNCICLLNDKRGKYFRYGDDRLNIFILAKGISLQNYNGYTFQVDHINNNTCDNYKDNLEITTISSNQNNKCSKKYYLYKTKTTIKYRVNYASSWKYFDLYIGGLKQLYFNTEEEAIAEYKRRKEIVNKYRFRAKTLEEVDEIIDFAEEHDLDIDSAYIVWKGLDDLKGLKEFIKTLTNDNK